MMLLVFNVTCCCLSSDDGNVDVPTRNVCRVAVNPPTNKQAVDVAKSWEGDKSRVERSRRPRADNGDNNCPSAMTADRPKPSHRLTNYKQTADDNDWIQGEV